MQKQEKQEKYCLHLLLFTKISLLHLKLKEEPVAEMLKKAAGVGKGSSVPNRDKVAKIKRSQARKIAELKMQDMNARDLEMATNCVLWYS